MTKHFTIALVAMSALLPGVSNAAVGRVKPAIQPPAIHALADNTAWIGESGTASYYGPKHQGRRSASGVRFDQRELTAAHPWLPFGTKVKVTLASTGRSVIVTITDRLYSNRRIVDLSVAAARELGMIRAGIGNVTLLPV